MFAKNEEGVSTAYIDILPSRATIGDTTWQVAPSTIVYSKNRLQVNGFSVSHDNQMLAINGTATNNIDDSLVVTLNDIDVSYVLNLVNFHSVDFYGMASGEARVAGAFSEKPLLSADVIVKDFKFEMGRMGTLFANVGYNHDEGRVEIDAVAKDDDNRWTDINGYVSPKHNYINLAIDAHRTRAEFMESFCGSFMDNVDADINGNVNVVGQGCSRRLCQTICAQHRLLDARRFGDIRSRRNKVPGRHHIRSQWQHWYNVWKYIPSAPYQPVVRP